MSALVQRARALGDFHHRERRFHGRGLHLFAGDLAGLVLVEAFAGERLQQQLVRGLDLFELGGDGLGVLRVAVFVRVVLKRQLLVRALKFDEHQREEV